MSAPDLVETESGGMKVALTLAALFAAFAIGGTVDYDTAAALAAEHSAPVSVAWGARDVR